MLALATLLSAVLALTPKPALTPGANVPCPTKPATTITATARLCPALEVSGQIDGGVAEIDPAFSAMVAPSELARFGRGDAILSGYTTDGKIVFILPVPSDGPFHFYIPLSPQYVQSLARLTLAVGGAVAERDASTHGEPEAEAVAVDVGRVLFAWNAQIFPAVRITSGPTDGGIAYGNGSSTLQQVTVASTTRRLTVEFSDGVHSFSRTYAIFGR
jgi:hypothetical protein